MQIYILLSTREYNLNDLTVEQNIKFDLKKKKQIATFENICTYGLFREI